MTLEDEVRITKEITEILNGAMGSPMNPTIIAREIAISLDIYLYRNIYVIHKYFYIEVIPPADGYFTWHLMTRLKSDQQVMIPFNTILDRFFHYHALDLPIIDQHLLTVPFRTFRFNANVPSFSAPSTSRWWEWNGQQ